MKFKSLIMCRLKLSLSNIAYVDNEKIIVFFAFFVIHLMKNSVSFKKKNE